MQPDLLALLTAAEAAGLVLKSTCRTGGCGACSAVLAAGQMDMGKHDPGVLDVSESENGILLCRSFPRGDCRIGLPYDRDQVVTSTPTRQQAEITGLDRVADAVIRVKVTLLAGPDGPSSLNFDSGQFVRITVPGTDARRAYSPANVPNWDGELEFYIRLLPGGLMSTYLMERAAVGDVLTVSGPHWPAGVIHAGRERPSAPLVSRRRHRIVAVAVNVAANGRVGGSSADTSVLRSHLRNRSFRRR